MLELLIGGVILGFVLLLPQGPIVSGVRSTSTLVNSVNHGKERKSLIADIAKRITMAPTAPIPICGTTAGSPCYGIEFVRNWVNANGIMTTITLRYVTECSTQNTNVSSIDSGIYKCLTCQNGSLPIIRVTAPNFSQVAFPLGPRSKALEISVAGALCVTQSDRNYELELLSLITDEKGKTRVVKDQTTAVAQDPNARVKLLR